MPKKKRSLGFVRKKRSRCGSRNAMPDKQITSLVNKSNLNVSEDSNPVNDDTTTILSDVITSEDDLSVDDPSPKPSGMKPLKKIINKKNWKEYKPPDKQTHYFVRPRDKSLNSTINKSITASSSYSPIPLEISPGPSSFQPNKDNDNDKLQLNLQINSELCGHNDATASGSMSSLNFKSELQSDLNGAQKSVKKVRKRRDWKKLIPQRRHRYSTRSWAGREDESHVGMLGNEEATELVSSCNLIVPS